MFIIFHLNSFHKFEVYLIILNKQMEMNVFFKKKTLCLIIKINYIVIFN